MKSGLNLARGLEVGRADRVAELIRRIVSDILRAKVSDPRIGFTSVTAVKVSPDLKYAKIYVSVLGEAADKDNTMKGLASASRYIRGELGHQLALRRVPEISFIRDDSLERGFRLLTLMKKIEEKP